MAIRETSICFILFLVVWFPRNMKNNYILSDGSCFGPGSDWTRLGPCQEDRLFVSLVLLKVMYYVYVLELYSAYG